MPRTAFQVLIAGRSEPDVQSAAGIVRSGTGYEVSTAFLAEHHGDPLKGVERLPDAIVYCIADDRGEELQGLSGRAGSGGRPPLLVIGPSKSPELLRMAMRAGARDFFTHPIPADELIESLAQLERDKLLREQSEPSQTTAVVAPKGGAGASVVASNLAHIIATQAGSRVVLVDMDLQFGALPLFLDMRPNDGLLQAIDEIEKLDSIGLEGWMLKHESGLHLLSHSHRQFVHPNDVSEHRLSMLLDLLHRSYQQVIIDLPRNIDPLFATIVERADRILLVIQPGVDHLQAARQMTHILVERLSVPNEKLLIVANRWTKGSQLDLKQLERVVGPLEVVTLHDDYKRVSESVNLGVPLSASARGAPLTRDLLALAQRISPMPFPKAGLLKRLLKH